MKNQIKKGASPLFNTLRKKLIFFSLLLTAVLVFPLYFVSSKVFFQNIFEDYANFELNAFSQTSSYLKVYLETLDGIIDKVYFSEPLTHAFSQDLDSTSLPDVLERVGAVEEELKHFLFSTQNLDHVVFLGKNNFSYLYQANLKSGQYAGSDFNFSKFIESAALPEESLPSLYLQSPALDSSPSEKLVTQTLSGKLVYWKMIRSQNGEPLLAVLCVFRPEVLKESYPADDGLSRVSLIDKDHSLAYRFSAQRFVRNTEQAGLHDVSKGYFYRTVNNNELLETYYTLSASNLDLVSRIPLQTLREHYQSVVLWNWSFVALCFLLVLLLAIFLSKRITEPLHRLSESLLAYSGNVENPGAVKPLKSEHSKLFRHYRLRAKIIFFFLISTLLPCCLFVFCLFFSYINVYTGNLKDLTSQTVSQARRNLDYKLKIFDDFTTDLIYGDTVQDIFNKLSDTGISESDYAAIKQLMMDTKYSRREIYSLQLYDRAGIPMFADSMLGKTIDPELLLKLNESNGSLLYMGTDNTSSTSPTLHFARLVHNVSHPNLTSPAGYLSIHTNHDLINGILQDIKPTGLGYCFAIDQQKNLISHYNINLTHDLLESQSDSFSFLSQESGSFVRTLKGENYLVLFEKAELSDLTVVGVIPYSDIHQHAYPILKYAALLLLLCVIVVVIFSTLISLRNTAPLNNLQQLMGRVAENDLEVWADHHGEDEVGVLNRQFNMMIDRLNTLIKDNYQAKIRESNLETLEKEAQIRALQQQINPHFLYNTLETIKWMAYEKGARDICDMVTALGKFFRGSISKENGLIPFSQEIEHLKTYLYIQEIRYCGKFDVIWDISPDILSHKTVKLILQPLVENAILHGMEELESGGHITIRIHPKEDCIFCAVDDNGAGMPPERLEEVMHSLLSEDKGPGSIGLMNVYRRLRLSFGEAFHFEIQSEPGKGTRIQFEIPSIVN